MATPLVKANVMLKAFGTLKIPMIGYLRPKLLSVTDEEAVVRIPLGRRSRNHLGSMYFGALSVGADLAAGWAAMEAAEEAKARTGRRIDFVFKDSKGEFLRRPDGDVHFTCVEGQRVRAMVEAALESGERQNETVRVTATVPARTGDEPVATFDMTLSLKAR